MAKAPTFSLTILLFLAISLTTSSQEFPTKFSKGAMRRSEQLTHLHFYFHNILRGDPTALVVAQAATTNTYRTRFGEVVVIDDPLTEGPNLSSRAVGRAQGMYAEADERVPAYLMVYNHFFTQGRFNGSKLRRDWLRLRCRSSAAAAVSGLRGGLFGLGHIWMIWKGG